MTPKKEENINSLCKKYFTPELCDEPVTESKAALKGKIWEQLLKYGDWICNNNFSYQGDADTFCEIILNTVESCWCKYEEKIDELVIIIMYFYKSLCINIIKIEELLMYQDSLVVLKTSFL